MLSDAQIIEVYATASAGRSMSRTMGDAGLTGLRAVEAAVRADTLQEFAETLRERYPEDVFPKPNDENYHALNVALARANITLDRFSADLMRRAAAQADIRAAEIADSQARSEPSTPEQEEEQ